MFRIFRLLLIAFISFNSGYFVKNTASAVNIDNIIGGVIGGVLQNRQQDSERKRQKRTYKKEQKRQERQYQAEQERLQNAENERLIMHFKRVQTALKSLGFYTAKIDGDFGDGSKAAYSNYISAFNLSYIDPEYINLQELEGRASEGWKSAEEYRFAQAGNFNKRDEYIKAKQSGFSNRASWLEARQKGFFNKDEYSEFLNSGIASAEEFRENGNAIRAKREIAEKCLTFTEEGKWLEAERSCAFALVAAPNDLAISSSHKRAQREVDRIVERAYDERQAALDIIQPAIGSNEGAELDSQNGDVATAQKTLMATNLLIAEVGLRRGASNCEALYSSGAYQETLDECEAIFSEHTNLAFSNNEILTSQKKLEEIIALAKEGVKESNKKASAEQEKLAFQKAQDDASKLKENVSRYIASGSNFGQPLEIAQALANLRKATSSRDTNIIVSSNNALLDLVKADANYMRFASERLEADQAAKAAALVQTRYNVQKMDVFVADFVTNNLLDERVGPLLSLKSSLSAALQSGDEDQLKSMNVTGREKLSELDLTSQLDGFMYTPDGAIVSTEDVAASQNNAELEKSALLESTNAAETMLQNIKKFSESKQRFQEPLKVASSVALLRKALGSNATADIQLRVSELDDHLMSDDNYSAFASSLIKASNASLANAASKSRETLGKAEAFLIDYISNNITAENIGQFIEKKQKISDALKIGTDEGVVSIENEFTEFAASNRLTQSFTDYVEASLQRNVSSDTNKAANGLAINAVNASLLEGHPDDLIILRNATPSAPHAGKNLLGKITFSQEQANICSAHVMPQRNTATRLAMKKLRDAGIVEVEREICNADNYLHFDLVVLVREEFLNASVKLANEIVEAFEEGKLVSFVDVTHNEIEQFNAANGIDAELLANEVRAGVKDGFGIIQIQNSSPALCVTPEENIAVHEQMIGDSANELEILLVGGFKVEQHSLDQAYVLSQRNQCGSIYASEKDLSTLLTALDRDKQDYVMVPRWFLTGEFIETKAYIDGLSNASDQELAKKSQEREARINLEKAKLKKAEEERIAKQTLLRDKNLDAAMGILEPMADSIKQNILNGSESKELSMFEQLNKKITGLKEDLWKFKEVDYSLVDYGIADWQGREVSAVVARFFYKSENAAQGVLRTDCALIGYLVDKEFDQNRDPILTGCDQPSDVQNWMQSRKFISLWNLQ